jgi:hypothetical protein
MDNIACGPLAIGGLAVPVIAQRATGPTDAYILQNKIRPGGTYGWHPHPRPKIVVVQSGALTLNRSGDAACTPQVYAASSGFVDQGGDVHVVRNAAA